MAVVQISRIQVRRGKANSGTGLPQLASGELAWAIDNQQLYIGNGSVAEGSPAVGNTKILTENDLSAQGNILNLIKHIYKVGEEFSVQTGPSLLIPYERTLQERLDDRVSLKDFGAIGNGVADDTAAFQRAIDQLYLNPSVAGSKVAIDVPAGTYLITETIYVPSYVSLIGEGADCTIFRFEGDTGPFIKFVNETSTIGSPAVITTTTSNNQPKFITFRDFTVHVVSEALTGLQLDCVADSLFENLVIEGDWDGAPNEYSRGIQLNCSPVVVAPTQRNVFNNVSVAGFRYAVFAKDDIVDNTFVNANIGSDDRPVFEGFAFGNGNLGGSIGNTTGPVNNIIDSAFFKNVKKQAVYIERGTGNTVSNCKLEDVGNDGGGNVSASYPQIYFKFAGNFAHAIKSDRFSSLGTGLKNVPYYPEVSGHGEYESFGTQTVYISSLNPPINYSDYPLFRLPVVTDDDGNPSGAILYQIDYVYRSNAERITRSGTITLSADPFKTYVTKGGLQLSDDYVYVGPDAQDDTLQFTAVLFDVNGAVTTGANDSIPHSIGFYYVNDAGGGGTFQFSYKAIF